MAIDGKWQQIGVDLPSLLPLQAAPQDEAQVVQYLQSLHNYLADDRQKVVRALNVLSTFRTLVDEDEDDRPPASGSLAMLTESLTGQMFLDVETSTGVYEWIPLVPEYAAITKEPTGFVDTNQDTTLAIAAGVFSITPTGDDFTFYIAGEKFVKTAAETLSLAAATTAGNWYIYYNSDGDLVLDGSVTFEDIIRDNAFVAELYHNGTSLQGLMDERHGLMPWQSHLWLHIHEGTIHRSGLGLANFTVDAAGNDDVDAEFTAAAGVIIDEDIHHSLAAMTGNWDNLYYTGTAWTYGTTGAESPVEVDTGVPQWNDLSGTPSLEDVTNNKFFLMHIFATGIILDGTGGAKNGHVAIVGQAEYATKTAAREGANTEIGSIVTAGLPMPEFLPVGTVIFKRQGSNAYNCAVVSTDTGDDYVSWLGAEIKPGVPPASHALLTHRDDPAQHPADSVATDVSDFGGVLSSADDEVQAALDTLDDHTHGTGTDDDAIHDNVDDEIYAIAQKSPPLSEEDLVLIEDADDSYSKKKVRLVDLIDSGIDLTIPATLTLPHTVDFADAFFTTGEEFPSTSFYLKDELAAGVVRASGYSSAQEPDYPADDYTISKIYDTNTTGGTAGFWIDLGDEAVVAIDQTAIIRMEVHVSGTSGGANNRIMCELATHPTLSSTGPTFGRVRNAYRVGDNIYRTYENGAQLATNIWGASTWSYPPGPTGETCVFQVEFDFSVPQIKSRIFGTYDTNIGRQDGGWKTESVPTLDDIDRRLRYAKFSYYAGTGTARYIFHQAWIGTGAHAFAAGRVDS